MNPFQKVISHKSGQLYWLPTKGALAITPCLSVIYTRDQPSAALPSQRSSKCQCFPGLLMCSQNSFAMAEPPWKEARSRKRHGESDSQQRQQKHHAIPKPIKHAWGCAWPKKKSDGWPVVFPTLPLPSFVTLLLLFCQLGWIIQAACTCWVFFFSPTSTVRENWGEVMIIITNANY